jgi:hypothetical protein
MQCGLIRWILHDVRGNYSCAINIELFYGLPIMMDPSKIHGENRLGIESTESNEQA